MNRLVAILLIAITACAPAVEKPFLYTSTNPTLFAPKALDRAAACDAGFAAAAKGAAAFDNAIAPHYGVAEPRTGSPVEFMSALGTTLVICNIEGGALSPKLVPTIDAVSVVVFGSADSVEAARAWSAALITVDARRNETSRLTFITRRSDSIDSLAQGKVKCNFVDCAWNGVSTFGFDPEGTPFMQKVAGGAMVRLIVQRGHGNETFDIPAELR